MGSVKRWQFCLRMICIFNANQIKIPPGFFIEVDSHMDDKKSRIAKAVLKN